MFESDYIQTTLTPILAIIGAVFGLLGTGIGVLNLWLRWKTQKTCLAIGFELSDVSSKSDCLYASSTIVVRNLSSFAVTVIEVGIFYKTGLWRREFKSHPQIQDRIGPRDVHKFHAYILPIRMEPQGWASHQVWAESLENAVGAYAVLVDGTRFRSKSIKNEIETVRLKILEFEKNNATSDGGFKEPLGPV